MFDEMTKGMLERMAQLEAQDARERDAGVPRLQRLRQIPADTGRFLALTAANCPKGEFIEIGTSAGYSTMWLSLAARERGLRLKTFELMEAKICMARETFRAAGIEEWVELVEGDALANLSGVGKLSFCFLDCEKELYDACWSIVSEKMVPGGVLVADNATSHYDDLRPMIERAMADARFDCAILSIGTGEFFCRRK